MNLIESFIVAFSMYSKIPMPQITWKESNMKYALCFFPLVGAVIGGLVYLWGTFGKYLGMGNTWYTAVLVLIPILVTGGIHLDGFLDTCDALSSWQTKERRLEILKDPHTGAFAIICCCSYFLAALGIWTEVSPDTLGILCIGFFFSRTLSGWSVTRFTCAKTSGLAATFANGADRKSAGNILLVEAILAGASMLYCSFPLGLVAILTAGLTLLFYRKMAYDKFGGITGDLAGFFLQSCELLLAVMVITVAHFL